MQTNKKNPLYTLLALILALVLINYGSGLYHKRFDLTKDKRYTLSENTVKLIEDIDQQLAIKVYLQGDFPTEFKRLQAETQQFLEELGSINPEVQFRFIDPLSSAKELVEKGLQPSRLTVQEGGKVSEAVIFPWALVNYMGKEERVPLLVSSSAPTQEQQMQNSIENLEYAFARAIQKVVREKQSKIAVLKGNGQLQDIQLYSFLQELGQYYHLAPFTLDSLEKAPVRTLEQLRQFDLAIVAKPTKAFSEQEKYALDQYVMQGGRSMWFIDNVQAEMDSLMKTGKSLAFNRDLGLTDLFFNYGVRINFNVTKDLYSSTVRLASGNTGNQTQYQDFLWPYYPLVFARNDHPVTKNLDPVLLKFPSGMDTLGNDLRKTVLLSSSARSALIGTPTSIALEEIAEGAQQAQYQSGEIPFGVLLEGNFTSAYGNRIKPFDYAEDRKEGLENKMLIVSDGDLIANEVFRGEPLPLNRDKWTNQPYGNLDFALNATHYLLDEHGIIELRAKNLQIPFLDKERAYAQRSTWQMINLLLPLLLLLVGGLAFHFIRKNRYGKA